MTRRIVILLGPPGSGKGELAKNLIHEYGFQPLATGDLIRQHIDQDDAIGRIAKKYIGQGKLVPNEIIIPLALKSLGLILASSKVPILDGFPRDYEQAQELIKSMCENGLIPILFYLDVRLEVCIKRILETRYAESIAKTGAPRIDDNPEAVNRRMDEFRDITLPGINLLVQQFPKNVYQIDAEKNIKEVNAQAQGILDKLGFLRNTNTNT